MSPANPPLPTPCILPFQFNNGIQTSNLMSESFDGLILPATRHAVAGTRMDWPVGGWNWPTGTEVAMVSVVCGNFSDARLSQVAAAGATCSRAARTVTNITIRMLRITRRLVGMAGIIAAESLT